MFYLFWIPVKVKIRHDFPIDLPANATTHTEHFPCQQPPHKTHSMRTFVVAGDCHIHMVQWRVSVAECNNRNVYVG